MSLVQWSPVYECISDPVVVLSFTNGAEVEERGGVPRERGSSIPGQQMQS